MMTSISKKLVSEAEKIRLRKRDLRGLIRNNLALLNIMTEDLTIYLSRLPKSKQNQVNKYIKWFLANLDELVRRVELSFSIESEDTRENSNIITIPSPPDDIPHCNFTKLLRALIAASYKKASRGRFVEPTNLELNDF